MPAHPLHPTELPDVTALAHLGIGSAALHGLSDVHAPEVDVDHPWIRRAADPGSREAAVIAGSVVDPEIPVLTVADLGILRRVQVCADGTVEVDITPTYSGCPAVTAMSTDIRRALTAHGHDRVVVRTVLSPAWTTDDMTDTAREMLQRFGIAPPGPATHTGPVELTLSVRCPHCGSTNTSRTSRFGSTSCKSMWTCTDCREPFDHFKTLH